MHAKTKYTTVSIPPQVVGVELKITGSMQGREGLAFTAEVHKDGKIVGTIENQGTGGGTWFSQHTREAGEWWDEAVEAYKPILRDEDPEFGDSFANESLADALYDDAQLKKDLDRKRSPLARFDGNNDEIMIYKGALDETLRTQLRNKAGRDTTVEVWIKGKGWESA